MWIKGFQKSFYVGVDHPTTTSTCPVYLHCWANCCAQEKNPVATPVKYVCSLNSLLDLVVIILLSRKIHILTLKYNSTLAISSIDPQTSAHYDFLKLPTIWEHVHLHVYWYLKVLENLFANEGFKCSWVYNCTCTYMYMYSNNTYMYIVHMYF